MDPAGRWQMAVGEQSSEMSSGLASSSCSHFRLRLLCQHRKQALNVFFNVQVRLKPKRWMVTSVCNLNPLQAR